MLNKLWHKFSDADFEGYTSMSQSAFENAINDVLEWESNINENGYGYFEDWNSPEDDHWDDY